MPATHRTTDRGEPIMYDDAKVRTMHPRQQAVLLPISPMYRDAIVGRAHLIMNTRPGYIFSQALSLAARDLANLDYDLTALEHLDRRDNLTALASCGCAACTRDLNR